MKTLLNPLSLLLIIFFCLIISCESDNSSYKDFEIAIIGTDYAEVTIKSYQDSTQVAHETFDLNHVKSLHFSNISKGKYIIVAYCPYKNLKKNEVSIVADYSGDYGSYALYFYK